MLVLPLSDLDINCVSLINQYSMGLSNPRTQAMFGILELYDYIMLFLLLILIIKMIFFINALCTSTQYISAYDVYAHEKELKIFDSYFKKLGGVHEEKFNLHKIVFGRITESSMIPKSSPGNIALNDFIRKDF